MAKAKGNIALLLAALFWGFCFVAQNVGMEQVGAFTFQGTRCLLGAFVLTLLSVGMDWAKKKRGAYQAPTPEQRKTLWKGGLCCGLVLFVAANLQQVGILYTTVAKAGFITSMYMVLVPIFSVVLGRAPQKKHWFCVALAAVGLYFLSITGGFSLGRGDTLVLLCACAFTVHILVIDHFAPLVDGVKISCIQFWIAGVLSCLVMAFTEQPTWSAVQAAWIPIVYAGVVSCAGGYTLQIIGQQTAEPVVATLLMSLESVFSLLGGMLILQQIPTPRELFGCVLVFLAVVLAQVPIGKASQQPAPEVPEGSGG